MAKKTDDDKEQVAFRVDADEGARLEKIAGKAFTKTAIARQAFLVGLAAIEKNKALLATG